MTEAVRLMLQHRVSGLPVVDRNEQLVGIITEGDLLRRTETGTEKHRTRWLEFLISPGKLAGEYVKTHGRKIAELMTGDVVTVTEDTTLDEVVLLMERHRVKRLPVVRDGQLVGIVSRANLLHALAAQASDAVSSAIKNQFLDDATIRDRLLAEMERQAWSPHASVNVIVRNGIVELWGSIFDEREREALRVAAENIPGVREVRDHLVWLEPYSGFVVEAPAGDASMQAAASKTPK